jgi:hypothetical protein
MASAKSAGGKGAEKKPQAVARGFPISRRAAPRHYIRGRRRVSELFRSFRLEAGRRRFAGAAVSGQLIADLLTFIEAAKTSLLDSADVDENVLAAIVGLDEAEALLTVEPFHYAGSHA